MAYGKENHYLARKKMESESIQLASWTGLDNNIKARRQVGRPKRRWEDDLNEFMKTEEGHENDRYDLKNNNNWMKEIEDYKRWKENEEKFSKS